MTPCVCIYIDKPCMMTIGNMAIAMSIVVLVLIGLSLLVSLLHTLLKLIAPKHKYYGPPSYPLIGCLISFYRNRPRLLDWYTHLLSESPTQTILVSRLGARRTIVTANPSNVEHILRANFPNFPKGRPFTDLLGDLLGCGIFNADGHVWRHQRKLVSHEFSARALRDFMARTLRAEMDCRLIPMLESAADGGDVVDMQQVLKMLAFDAICRVSLGVDPHCLAVRPDRNNENNNGKMMALAQAFDCAAAISAARGSAPVQALWRIKRALNLGSEKRLKRAVRLVRNTVHQIITNKKKVLEGKGDRAGDGADLLSRLLAAGQDDDVVRDTAISFIMAGRDTTSAAMTWLFWLLSKHPSVEREVAKEAASFSPSDLFYEYDALKEMKLTKACLLEAMRLYPPVAWDSKHAVAGDVLPDGTQVRAGDRVTYFPYGMGRMEELWGADRMEFRPDRWFEPGTGELRGVSSYKYPVFQAGPRVCMGKEMAMVQMAYVVASVLRLFEVRPVVCNEPPVFVPLLTAHMADGLRVRVRRRAEITKL